MPCGFCGIDGCSTKLIKANITSISTGPIIISDCIYHHEAMDYKAAAAGRVKNATCSNVPIHCHLCSLSPEGEPRTIWKYNAIMHVLLEHEVFHPNDPDQHILPKIPFEMQVEIHIPRSEELAFGIAVEHTREVRSKFGLLDSEDLPLEPPPVAVKRKRGRSNTESVVIVQGKKSRK